MTLYSTLITRHNLIKRTFCYAAGTQTITAPTGANVMQARGVGAGGYVSDGTPGSGAAFSRVKRSCVPGAQFSVQVGNISGSLDAGSSSGDSLVTRIADSVVLLKAKRGGIGTHPGLAGDCVGDLARSGSAGGGHPGASGTDLADLDSLGIGGPGVGHGVGTIFVLAACRGGGGYTGYDVFEDGSVVVSMPPGLGIVVMEFFRADPSP